MNNYQEAVTSLHSYKCLTLEKELIKNKCLLASNCQPWASDSRLSLTWPL